MSLSITIIANIFFILGGIGVTTERPWTQLASWFGLICFWVGYLAGSL